MNIFSKIKKQLFPDPEIGQTYIWADDVENPFDRAVIRIVDVQDGWVQYEYLGGNGRRFSKTIGDLRRFYVLEEV